MITPSELFEHVRLISHKLANTEKFLCRSKAVRLDLAGARVAELIHVIPDSGELKIPVISQTSSISAKRVFFTSVLNWAVLRYK